MQAPPRVSVVDGAADDNEDVESSVIENSAIELRDVSSEERSHDGRSLESMSLSDHDSNATVGTFAAVVNGSGGGTR